MRERRLRVALAIGRGGRLPLTLAVVCAVWAIYWFPGIPLAALKPAKYAALFVMVAVAVTQARRAKHARLPRSRSTMLWLAVGEVSFVGDVLVAIYLMVLPSLALILGSSASGSPHAAIGASREMKLVLGYELPLVLAFLVVLIKTAGFVGPGEQLSLVAIAQHAPVLSISGFLDKFTMVINSRYHTNPHQSRDYYLVCGLYVLVSYA